MFLPPKHDAQIHVGITIIPPPGVYKQLCDLLAQVLPPPLVSSFFPHVTLAGPAAIFPGEVPFVLSRVRRLLSRVEPFSLRLNGVGDFRPISEVVYLQVFEGGEVCKQMVQSLRFGALRTQTRFPYVPHLTLAQNQSTEVLDRIKFLAADHDIAFPVTNVLVDQILPGTLLEIAKIPLGGGKPFER